MTAQPHPRTHHHPPAAQAGSRSRPLVIAIALALALLVARPALATVVFNYYQITASPTAVVVEWSTAREVDVFGLSIAHKPVAAPDSAYQTTVFVFASGGPTTGAGYSVPFTALDAGVAYCFRLREQTTTGAPGEVLDRCGYGPGVTPTPAATPEFVPATPPARWARWAASCSTTWALPTCRSWRAAYRRGSKQGCQWRKTARTKIVRTFNRRKPLSLIHISEPTRPY